MACCLQRCQEEGKELSVCVVEKGAEVGAQQTGIMHACKGRVEGVQLQGALSENGAVGAQQTGTMHALQGEVRGDELLVAF